MKNALCKSLPGLFSLLFLLNLSNPVRAGVPPTPEVTCPTPEVSITEQAASSVTFSWNAVSGATQYRIWYVRREDNYTSSVITTGGTSVTFSNLTSGTYDFHFQTSCGGDGNSAIIIAEIMM